MPSRYKSVELRPPQGGKLIGGLAEDTGAEPNYSIKKNFRRELDVEMRREGWSLFNPKFDKNPLNMPLYEDDDVTLFFQFSRPNGDTALLAAAGDKLYRLFANNDLADYLDGEWIVPDANKNDGYHQGGSFSFNWKIIQEGVTVPGSIRSIELLSEGEYFSEDSQPVVSIDGVGKASASIVGSEIEPPQGEGAPSITGAYTGKRRRNYSVDVNGSSFNLYRGAGEYRTPLIENGEISSTAVNFDYGMAISFPKATYETERFQWVAKPRRVGEITITDKGKDYTRPPEVTIEDTVGNGTGAIAKVNLFENNRWEAVALNGYAICNNGIDLPYIYREEWEKSEQIYALRELGIVRVGCVAEHGGYLLCADLTEFADGELERWSTICAENDIDPYCNISPEIVEEYDLVINETQYAIVWSAPGDPREWGVSANGSISAGSNKWIPALPNVSKSFDVGQNFIISAAGPLGANLVTKITNIVEGSDGNILYFELADSASGEASTHDDVTDTPRASTSLDATDHFDPIPAAPQRQPGPSSPTSIDAEYTELPGPISPDGLNAELEGGASTIYSDVVTTTGKDPTRDIKNLFDGDTATIIASTGAGVDLDIQFPFTIDGSVIKVYVPSGGHAHGGVKFFKEGLQVGAVSPNSAGVASRWETVTISGGEFDKVKTLRNNGFGSGISAIEIDGNTLVDGDGLFGGGGITVATQPSTLGVTAVQNFTAQTSKVSATAGDEQSIVVSDFIHNSTAFSNTVGGSSTEILGDGSRILKMEKLMDVLIIYRQTGYWMAQLTQSSSDPFSFTERYTGNRAALFRHSVSNIVDKYHIFVGLTGVFKVDLTEAEPSWVSAFQVGPQFWKDLSLYDQETVFSYDNALTGEIWLCLPRELEDEATLAFDYRTNTLSHIDQHFTAGLTIRRPHNPFTERSDDMAIISYDGVVYTYGYGYGDIPSVFNRVGLDYTSVLSSTLMNFKDRFNEKDIRSYVLLLDQTDPAIGTNMQLFTQGSLLDEKVLVVDHSIDDLDDETMVPVWSRALFYKDKITVTGKDNPLRLASRMFEVSDVNSRSQTQATGEGYGGGGGGGRVVAGGTGG